MILNNDIRLKIINILYINKRHAYYTELLNILDLPASSNFAYHMNILHNTLIVEKDENGRYYLTEYGIQSSLKYKLMNGTDSFPLIKAHLGISRLQPIEVLLSIWVIFILFFGKILILDSNILFGIFLISISFIILIYTAYRTKILSSLMIIPIYLWIFSLLKNRFLLILIMLTSLIGIYFFIPNSIINNINFIGISISIEINKIMKLVLGIILITISIISSSIYLLKSYKIRRVFYY
ncbi:MAG: hypothetical protein JXA99_10210 [Candidatus Lokiarchaeota archaeon]|nr:hypothetical protein [Candidatus Lokiarchaeota archaeon]